MCHIRYGLLPKSGMSCVVTRHPGTILKIPGYQVWCYEFQGEHAAYETAELGRVRVSGAEEPSSTGCDSYRGQRRGEREVASCQGDDV